MELAVYVGYILQLIMQPLIATNHLIDQMIRLHLHSFQKSSGFVFAFMSFTSYLISGPLVIIIQKYFPKGR